MSKLKKALEKAKVDRDVVPGHFEVGGHKRLAEKDLKQDKIHSDILDRHELKFDYTYTKILNIDPEALRKNRVISNFKENEMAEQISILKIQILNKLDEIRGNSLMVTSAHAGEGKTFTSINLGVSIAQELDRTVLIVDCDLRKPSRNHFDFSRDFFGITTEVGLSDYLLGKANISDILLNPGIPRLTIIPGGKSLINSSELLGSQKMQLLINEVKQRYGKNRIVIFDSPAMIKASDPLTFSKYVEGVLLVVESERTSSDDIKKVLSLLENRTIIGTILNKHRRI